jgi:uncharacterized protein YcbX
MTGEVKRLYERPLTGARAKEVKKVAISAGGIIGNRLIVVYNSFDSNNLKRVSQKEIRELAQLHARINAAGRVSITHKREDLDLDGFHLNPKEEPDLYVNEFNDPTPAIDMGDIAADSIRRYTKESRYSGKAHLRLAQKTLTWHQGGGTPPSERKNAPLHVVTSASMSCINELLAENGSREADYNRFRPDIVIDVGDEEPFVENEWKKVSAGGVVLKFARVAERCSVPGNDQLTGEKMLDIPPIYKHLPQSENGKAIFGIYMYADLPPGVESQLEKGSIAEIA